MDAPGQGLSYELPLMFALITVGVGARSLRTTDVVAAQADLWFVVTMPVAFVVFLASAAAFAFWGPFAAPAGADVAGGVTSELSGAERLLVDLGRMVLLGAAAAMATALFLGGDAGPWLPGPLWYLLKTVGVLALLVVVGRRSSDPTALSRSAGPCSSRRRCCRHCWCPSSCCPAGTADRRHPMTLTKGDPC